MPIHLEFMMVRFCYFLINIIFGTKKMYKNRNVTVKPQHKKSFRTYYFKCIKGFFYVLGALQTIKCMLKLKFNIRTNYISNFLFFCQLWYTISQTVMLHFITNLATSIYSCFFLKIENSSLYIFILSFFEKRSIIWLIIRFGR